MEFDVLEVDFNVEEGGQPTPMQSYNTLRPDLSAHNTATFVDSDVPQSGSSEFPTLNEVLQGHYGFMYSPSICLVFPSNTIIELAMKVCEG